MTTNLCKPATATGYQPGPVSGRWLRACVSLLCAVSLAVWLLFWFFESLSPRMDAIAQWETRNKMAIARPHPNCLVTGTLLCLESIPDE